MMRGLHAVRVLREGDSPALPVFRRDPGAWLPDLTRPGGDEGHWQVYLWGGQVGVLVDLTLGPAVVAGDVVRRSVRWDPGPWLGVRVLPGFVGELTAELDPAGRTVVGLEGGYRTPGGALGWLADAAVLHRLAARTARQLLADIAERVARLDADPEAT
jgi:hypothetical protein